MHCLLSGNGEVGISAPQVKFFHSEVDVVRQPIPLLLVRFPSGCQLLYDKGRNIICSNIFVDTTVADPDGIESLIRKTSVVCLDVVCDKPTEHTHRDRLHLILQRIHDTEAAIPQCWLDPSQPIHVRVANLTMYRSQPSPSPVTLKSRPVNVMYINSLYGLLRRNIIKETNRRITGVLFTVEVDGAVVGAAVITNKRRVAMFRLATDEPIGRAGRILMDALLVRCMRGTVVVAPSAIGFFLSLGWRRTAEHPVTDLTEPTWLAVGQTRRMYPFQVLQSIYHGRDITQQLSEATRFSVSRPVWVQEGAWKAAVYGGTFRHMRFLHLRSPPLTAWDMTTFHAGMARSFLLRMDAVPHVWITMKH